MKEGDLFWFMVLEVHNAISGGAHWFEPCVRLEDSNSGEITTHWARQYSQKGDPDSCFYNQPSFENHLPIPSVSAPAPTHLNMVTGLSFYLLSNELWGLEAFMNLGTKSCSNNNNDPQLFYIEKYLYLFLYFGNLWCNEWNYCFFSDS